LYWLIKKRGQSLVSSFKTSSLNFTEYLYSKSWFLKLAFRYDFINDFFNERKHAKEKLFGSVLIFSFLIVIYILILVLKIGKFREGIIGHQTKLQQSITL